MVEKKQNQITIRLSELLYLIYLGLMLFAKGIGLYDGQISYKVFLLAAFACVAVKFCITEYTVEEWLLILLLIGWSAVVYCVSGEKGILICVLTVVAMKQVSLKRIFAIGLMVWSIAMGGRFLLSLLFLDQVQTAVQTKNFFGALLRYFMGYPHPNVLHISYFVLAAFAVYCLKERYNWRHTFLLMVGNGILFLYSYSFTGVVIVTVYLLASLMVSSRKVPDMIYRLAEIVFPCCVLFSVFFPILLSGKAYELADRFFNNRINFARYFLTMENMALFGNNLADITTDVITMDNSFVFALVIYGVPLFVIICIGYLSMIHSYVKQKRNMELVMIGCFLIAGITEPFLFNTSFKNLTLFFMGEWLFTLFHEEQRAYILLKGKNPEWVIPFGRLSGLRNEVMVTWNRHKFKLLGIGTAFAVICGGIGGMIYRPRAAVLEVQRDHLLLFERLRVTVTVFAITWGIVLLLLLVIYYFKEVRWENNKYEDHA